MIEFADSSTVTQLGQHGIDAATVERIITEAESKGSKLCLPGRNVFLTKAELASSIVYVKYTLEQGSKPRILLVYSTKARFTK